MILVDANILMYAAGTAHPHKQPSVRFLERTARGQNEAALDAESLQEILHRYRSLGRWSEGQHLFELARQVFPEVLPVTGEVMDQARHLMELYPRLACRDAVHAAVVLSYQLRGICSYDPDFDVIEQIERVEP